MNDLKEVLEFQRAQQDIVIMIGTYLAPVGDFLEKCKADINQAEDINAIRRLQSHVGNKLFLLPVNQFLTKYNYEAYYRGIVQPYHNFANLLARQTLPSQKLNLQDFVTHIENEYKIMAETLIALAQIPLPQVNLAIKGNSPFTAYCFITHILSTVRDYLYIIDPWIDESLFYRYLYRLPKSIKIRILSSSDKWSKNLRRVESVEELFKMEYPNYCRKDDPNIHDRVINFSSSFIHLKSLFIPIL